MFDWKIKDEWQLNSVMPFSESVFCYSLSRDQQTGLCFVNKVTLEHCHTCLFASVAAFTSQLQSQRQYGPQSENTLWPFIEKCVGSCTVALIDILESLQTRQIWCIMDGRVTPQVKVWWKIPLLTKVNWMLLGTMASVLPGDSFLAKEMYVCMCGLL